MESRKLEREQITIRLPKEMKEEIHRQANRRGDSFNGVVMVMLNKALELMHQGLL